MMTIVLLSTISNRQIWQNSKHYFRVYRITYRDVAKAKSLVQWDWRGNNTTMLPIPQH